MLNKADLHLPPEDIYEVWDAHGRLLGRSPNWQGGGESAPALTGNGFARLDVNGRPYRVLRARGSRIVDPGEPGGGKLRQVSIVYGAPTEHVWHAIRGAVEFYAAGSLLLLVVTGPLIAWLLHRGLLPLRQLAALAGQVSAEAWEFSPPASARATPELAPLTHAIESVLQRLERAFVQQRTFVSDAAHELKTAVAVVKSSLQLLGLKPRTAAEYQAGLERCLADSARLEELVAKMLTLARLENASQENASHASGVPAVAPPPACDMGDCLRQTVAQLETVAALRNVKVTVAGPPQSACRVGLTAEDCALLVSNLLLNALQHSPPASRVELRLRTDGGAVELAVEDHGEGISPAALPHVFDRFYRGDPSRTRSTGGAGLGLAMCKAVVERAGGTIELASRPGQGTTVTVRLPLAEEPPVNVPPPSA
jgi:signal transduction histidine kinase